jgi:HflK protein
MLKPLLMESWVILKESAIFILFGFFLAAVMHVVMARGGWADWLRKRGTRSIMLATAVGLPMPLCSCSVLPAAISLRRQGASKGSVLAFLISTPETSFESVFLTYSLISLPMAIIRLVAGFATAIVAGYAEDFVSWRYDRKQAKAPVALPEATSSAADCSDCCHDHVHELPTSDSPIAKPGWADGFKHAFVEIFDDVIVWMIIGVVAAAAIEVLIPNFIIQAVLGRPTLAMFIMVLIGIPMYVCAEASTPIAAAFIAQGVSPGAALVFLLSGPASNIGSIGVLLKEMGRRTVVVYLTSIAVVSLAAGFATDWFLKKQGINLQARAMSEPLVPEAIKTIGALIFILLTVVSFARLHVSGRVAGWISKYSPVKVSPRGLGIFVVVLVAAIWISSGYVVVEPGQVAMLKRFGRVYHREAGPGLHFVGPYPIGAADIVDTRLIHRLDLAAAPRATAVPGISAMAPASVEETASWVLLGDENIANVRWTAHWRMQPGAAWEFTYGSGDNTALVKHAAGAAVREVLAAESIDSVYTVAQSEVAPRVKKSAQEALDRCSSGIELTEFLFLDVHAPTEVHDAFRDVASALEDKATRRNKALAYQAGVRPMALGTRAQLLLNAEAYRSRTVAEATGQAQRFKDVYAAYAEHPELTRLRMILEAYDKVLPGRPKCIKPGNANLYLDFRYGMNKSTKELGL